MNQIALINTSEIVTMGKHIAASKMFGIKTESEFVALALIAQAEGRHPAIVARDYHVISGRPTLKADAILARFQEAGGRVSWSVLTDTEARATFSHASGGTLEIAWTMDMAKKAGLTNNPTWGKYPRAMLRSRCVSEGVRSVYPAVLCGVYTPEEVGDIVHEEQTRSAPTPAPAPVETACEVIKTVQDELIARVKGEGKLAADLGRFICGRYNVKKLSQLSDGDANTVIGCFGAFRGEMLFEKEMDENQAESDAVAEETRDA